MSTFEAAGPAEPDPKTTMSEAEMTGSEGMSDSAHREPEPTTEALAHQAQLAIEALARSSNPAAFTELLRLSALVGECLGVSARSLAEGGSWAYVGEVAGVTRQAAWSRWASGTP